MPVCIAMRNPVMAGLLRPMPPLTDERRKEGTQLLSPHQANIVQPFMRMRAAVIRVSAGVLAGEIRRPDSPAGTPALPGLVLCQIAGSWTRRRIQNVRNAGRM